MNDGPPSPALPSTRRWSPGANLAVGLLLCCYFALGLSAASRKSQAGDEGIHLTGGVYYWATNDYRVQPASGNWAQRCCGLPVWLAGYRLSTFDDPNFLALREWEVADAFCYGVGNDIDRMLFLGRAMTGCFGVALGMITYVWARSLFGTLAGLFSLTLYVFSPSLLAHGFLITADMAAALFFTAAVGALWRLLHRVSLGTIILAWLALSGVLLAKFSGVIIVPMGLLLLAVRVCHRAPLVVQLGSQREVRGRMRQLAAFAALLLFLTFATAGTIWASFGFRYSMLNPALGPASREVAWEDVQVPSRVISTALGLARDKHLLPEAYLFGFAHTLSHAEQRAAFLHGEFRQQGWVSFFPYCLAIKTPLEQFVALGLSLAALLYFHRRHDLAAAASASGSRHLLYELVPLIVLLAVYWGFALTSHLNIGHRHLLPTEPAMLILAGAAAWWLKPPTTVRDGMESSATASPRRPIVTIMRLLVIGTALAAAAEALWAWPHYLAHFNQLVGGPRYGYRHLGDSSLDWSQDLKELKHWLDAHPDDARDPGHLYLSFYGGPPPEYYGIHAQRLPSFPDRWQPRFPEPLTGGTYLISATMLQCFMLSPPGRWNQGYEDSYQQDRQSVERFYQVQAHPTFKWQDIDAPSQKMLFDIFHRYERLRFSRLASYLRSREPDDQVGYSILIYRLTEEDLAKALDGPPVENLAEPEWQTEGRRLNHEEQQP